MCVGGRGGGREGGREYRKLIALDTAKKVGYNYKHVDILVLWPVGLSWELQSSLLDT